MKNSPYCICLKCGTKVVLRPRGWTTCKCGEKYATNTVGEKSNG